MSIRPAATSKAIRDRPIETHPFVIKLLTHASLDASDLEALNRLLNRRLTVKKGKDIIVQGFEYKELYIVESGFAVRYTLVHKGDIADAVGLSGPHANRMISQLKREGLIAIRRHEIKILDRVALQIIAEFDPSYLVPPSLHQLRTIR